MATVKDFDFLITHTSTSLEEVVKGEDDTSDISMKLKEGDLITTTTKDKLNAGIYCGNNQVIRLTAPPETHSWFLPQQSAPVSKVSLKNFLRGSFYHIHRLPSGIPNNFSDKVSEAMASSEMYDPFSNNGLHFALKLLELEAEPLPNRTNETSGLWSKFQCFWRTDNNINKKNQKEQHPLQISV